MGREESGIQYLEQMVRQGRRMAEAGMPLCSDAYCVVLFQLPEKAEHGQWRQLAEFLRRRRNVGLAGSEPFPYHNGFLMVIADRHGCSIEQPLQEWQQDYFLQYKETVSIGIGRSCTVTELMRSFQEARIAGLFQQVTGNWGFVQNFNRMGLFTGLFNQGTAEVQRFSRELLEPLREYDEAYHTSLMATLQALMANDFNWKQTAEALFVHVNTLRYRYEKIQQVLEWEGSGMEMRTNLFAAVRAGAILDSLDADEQIEEMLVAN